VVPFKFGSVIAFYSHSENSSASIRLLRPEQLTSISALLNSARADRNSRWTRPLTGTSRVGTSRHLRTECAVARILDRCARLVAVLKSACRRGSFPEPITEANEFWNSWKCFRMNEASTVGV